MSLKEAKIPSKDVYDLYRDGITQSIIMGFLKCRVSFLLHLNKWTSVNKKSMFAFGTLTHETLDKVYSYFQQTGEVPTDTMIKVWIIKYVKAHKDWLPSRDAQKGEQIKVNCFVIVSEYVKHYADDFKNLEIMGAEDTFRVKFMQFTLRGKKDMRFRIHGKKWLIETKTMARIDEETLSEKLAFDFQNLFYVTAEELEYPDEPTVGVLYNVIRNPSSKVTDKSLTDYQTKLRKKVQKNPEHYFLRYEVPYLQKDKVEFRRDLIGILTEIEGLLSGKVRIYRNFKNCVGRFSCGFLKACSSGTMIGYAQNARLFSELESST